MATLRHYLDHNATAPVRPEVREAVMAAMGLVGNPSSVHAEGRTARSLVEQARDRVAGLCGMPAASVIFTGGGTEANNTALRPGALKNSDGLPVTRLIVSATDHASVLSGHGFAHATLLPVDPSGRLDIDRLRTALAEGGGVPVVSVAAANSETGIIAPLAEVTTLVREAGGCLHVDAVQAIGRIDPGSLGSLEADAISLSGHKLGGVQGTGALLVAPGRAGPDLALLRGGAQEGRRRAGTENVPGLAGLGVAAACAARDLAGYDGLIAGLRDEAERQVLRIAPDATIFGKGVQRLPNTSLFAVPGLSADAALMAFDLAGIAVSSGSACSSGKVARSHVLAAMGVDPDLAGGAIRVSFGWSSSHEDVSAFAGAFETIVQRLYERRTRIAA